MGRLNEAIDCYNKAIKIDSNNFETYYKKGIILNDLGRNEEAINCLNLAI